MTEDNKPPLLDHEADGIQELDNFLPGWWLWLFYLSIGFFVVYMVYYHVLGLGELSHEQYKKEMAVATVLYNLKPAPDADALAAMEPSKDDAVLAKGKQLFLTHCVVCHTTDGGGLVGPNLCDDYFLHGPTFGDSVRTITEGVPIKGMISWGPLLRPSDIKAVASYVWTLRGTTPANPKAPQGEKFEG